MPCLVDTNVILDIFNNDPEWFEWSNEQLERLKASGELGIINPSIYSELSVWFDSVKVLESSLRELDLVYEETPKEGLFLAGKAFLKYKQKTGIKKSTLPDFFIGGHAEHKGYTVVTRDVRRFKTYFPKIEMVSP
ncbi:MAG: type II toxin-antitoxin system VapC family toxin [Spirochaetia bacterium]|nr:type II toxin-antitoxin system VapC family toxin [Spirochaetia bacterium]